MTSTWQASQHDTHTILALSDGVRPGHRLHRVESTVQKLARRAMNWFIPSVAAGYYDPCSPDCGDPEEGGDGGGGFDDPDVDPYYWDWTDFADSLGWGDTSYFDSDNWDWLCNQTNVSDFEWEVADELSAAGIFEQITNPVWNGHGFTGQLSADVVNQLQSDGNFASGILYGFHISEVPGGNLTDFRSYTGTFGDGSLQVVISGNSPYNFYSDVDRFNPYQDLVNLFGHTFMEVLPGLFKWISW
jgi:hypothetical protein